ncbi:MAG: hypothetical protein M3441_11985 [Chloroflexota bacterium]|nr:hypothetical protein [Chloroflexota bacterium]
MDIDALGGWPIALLAVVALAGVTIGFALLIGRWIDAQSNSVVDPPRKGRKQDSNRE